MSELTNHPLWRVNKSELVQMAHALGLGHVSRSHKREDLIRMIVLEDGELETDSVDEWRELMEAHIDKYRKRLLSQLPGCDGTCTTYGCPALIVTRCWEGFRHDMV